LAVAGRTGRATAASRVIGIVAKRLMAASFHPSAKGEIRNQVMSTQRRNRQARE